MPQAVPHVLRNYQLWRRFARAGFWEMTRMRNEVSRFSYRPEISILLPVYNPERAWLEAALDSVMGQAYPDWELCVCDDTSTQPYVKEVLDFYGRLDGRIRVERLQENRGISGATNAAFALSTGEFVAPMDHDDILTPDALFRVVELLQDCPDADLVYTDEDKINESGEPFQPHFKPGFSPDMALCVNYLVHLSVHRKSLVEEAGGWRGGFDGAQDLDLMLRFTERTDKIYHLPHILYRWRMVEGSTASSPSFKDYTHERGRRAVEDSLERRGVRGRVLDGPMANTYRIEREIEGQPEVSVVIPLPEGADPAGCVESLQKHTSYPEYEILLAVNGELPSHPEGPRVVGVSGETPLELCNAAAEEAGGGYLLFLSPDLEAVSEGWLQELLQHAQRREVGAVGGKLLSPEKETVEAGLILKPEKGDETSPVFYTQFNYEHPGFRMFLNVVRNCSAVSRSCMMVRRETFEALGGFDTARFEDTFGDVDLCLRMGEQGKLVIYTPYAGFVRHDPQPPGALGLEQADYVRRRWGGKIEDDPYYNPNLWWDANDLGSALKLMRSG